MKRVSLIIFAFLLTILLTSCPFNHGFPPKEGTWYCEELNATIDFDDPFDDRIDGFGASCNGSIDGQKVVCYYNLWPRVTFIKAPADNSPDTLKKLYYYEEWDIYRGSMQYRSDVEIIFSFKKENETVHMIFNKITSKLPHTVE